MCSSLQLFNSPAQDIGFNDAIETTTASESQVSRTAPWKPQETVPTAQRELGSDIVWRRGNVKFLAVNKQIHDECADVLYGDHTFTIRVAFGTIKFRFRWLTTSNLTPNGTKDFLTHFSCKNLQRIKKYIVVVELVDDYASMIKYNCGRRAQIAETRNKVRELVDLMADAPYLKSLRIHLEDGAVRRTPSLNDRVNYADFVEAQTVLSPFVVLRNVRQVKVTGVVPDLAIAKALEYAMKMPRE